jgi:hypothetical protein
MGNAAKHSYCKNINGSRNEMKNGLEIRWELERWRKGCKEKEKMNIKGNKNEGMENWQKKVEENSKE